MLRLKSFTKPPCSHASPAWGISPHEWLASEPRPVTSSRRSSPFRRVVRRVVVRAWRVQDHQGCCAPRRRRICGRAGRRRRRSRPGSQRRRRTRGPGGRAAGERVGGPSGHLGPGRPGRAVRPSLAFRARARGRRRDRRGVLRIGWYRVGSSERRHQGRC